MGKIKAQPKRKAIPVKQQMPSMTLEELIQQQGPKPKFGSPEWNANMPTLSDDEDPFDGFIEWREQEKALRRALPPKERLM